MEFVDFMPLIDNGAALAIALYALHRMGAGVRAQREYSQRQIDIMLDMVREMCGKLGGRETD